MACDTLHHLIGPLHPVPAVFSAGRSSGVQTGQSTVPIHRSSVPRQEAVVGEVAGPRRAQAVPQVDVGERGVRASGGSEAVLRRSGAENT